MSESSNAENLNQQVSHNAHDEAAPMAMAAGSHKQQKAGVNKGQKRKHGAAGLEDYEEGGDHEIGRKKFQEESKQHH